MSGGDASLLDADNINELRSLDSDGSFLEMLTATFEREFQQCLGELESLRDAPEPEVWRRHCHAARSLAGSVGATKLESVASSSMADPPATPAGARAVLTDLGDLFSMTRLALQQAIRG